MKHANKFNTAKLSYNQRIDSWLEESNNKRKEALKVAENTPAKIKNNNIKYLLKR